MTDNRLMNLEKQVGQLRALLGEIAGETDVEEMPDYGSMPREERPDYIEFGGEQHAMLLGLKRAERGCELPALDGWTLELTNLPPVVWASDNLQLFKEILRERVSELTTPPQIPQDEDPAQPNYLQPMWTPAVEEQKMRVSSLKRRLSAMLGGGM